MTYIRLCFSAFMIALCGCQHGALFHNAEVGHGMRLSQAEAAESGEPVFVGGKVNYPTTMIIPDMGLTIQQALAMAGGPQTHESQSTDKRSHVPEEIVSEYYSKCLTTSTRQFYEKNFSSAQENEGKFATPELNTWISSGSNAKDKESRRKAIQNFVEKGKARFERSRKLDDQRMKTAADALGQVADPDSIRGIKKSVEEYIEATILSTMGGSNGRGIRNWDNSSFKSEVKRTREAKDNAIRQVRGKRVSQAIYSSDSVLVALSRKSRSFERLFISYKLIASDALGEIQLAEGDYVQVIDMSDTGLMSEPNLLVAGAAFELKGLVTKPAIYSIEDGSAYFQRIIRMRRLDLDIPNAVWIVEQPASTGIGRDVFVLPDNGDLATLHLQRNATYTYASAIQAPLVAESLARKLVEAATAPTEESTEKRHLHSERRNQGALGKVLRENRVSRVVQGIGQTLLTRTGH